MALINLKQRTVDNWGQMRQVIARARALAAAGGTSVSVSHTERAGPELGCHQRPNYNMVSPHSRSERLPWTAAPE